MVKHTHMTQHEADELSAKIENEGFDYCFLEYGSFNGIKDEKFHELRKAFVNSQIALKKYLESQGVEIES